MEDDNLSRREFFKNVAKGILPFLAFIAIPQQIFANKRNMVEPNGCYGNSCASGCLNA